MNIEEQLRCIKEINPNAHCVVWEGGKVKYDKAHKGKKPTLKQCEAILSKVQGLVLGEHKKNDQKKLVDQKVEDNARKAAIAELIADGALPEDYTE